MLADAAPVVLAGLVFAGAVVAAATVAGLVAWRALRRRWRRVASHAAVRTAAAIWATTGAGQRWVPNAGADITRWSPQRARREMRRAVGDAEAAVRSAAEAGAPVGELPDLCRRLEAGAGDVDRLLNMGAAVGLGTEAGGVHRQVAEVLAASSSIRLAAVTAASDATAPRIGSLASDADREVECLTAGLASARASLPHPGT